MSRISGFVFASALIVLAALPASAQVATGTPPFGSFGGGPDVINLGNLNGHWTIPILHKPGRGTNFDYDLTYDSSVWFPITAGSSTFWQPTGSYWGWQGFSSGGGGNLTYSTIPSSGTCGQFGQYTWSQEEYTNFVYTDSKGATHPFAYTAYYIQTNGTSQCPPNGPQPSTTPGIPAQDGSGLTLYATPSTSSITPWTMIQSNGSQSYGSLSNYFFQDRNGNQITAASGVYTDTLGQTALTVGSFSPPSETDLSYTAPSGGTATYKVTYASYTVRTNFGCFGINEYGPTTVYLVDRVTLPDNSYYQFAYEATPGYSGDVTGRLASFTLPTGGTISYTYTGGNNGINCSDGTPPTLNRTTPDGTWKYARTFVSGTQWQTIMTDPAGNDTVMQFHGIYETQRQVYQGSHSSGTLLRTLNTCYNGAASPCNSTPINLPITQRNVTDQFGSSGLQCQHNYFYNSVGGLTERDDYDYGSGAPGPLLRKILVTYASLGNITAFQQRVTVCNGSGTSSSCTGPSGSSTGIVVAQTNYNYDENTPATTSGVAQHTSVSGSRGNLTSINYPVSGLTSHFTYWDTGSPNTSQDINGATTTYNYSSNTATCQLAFPTSISEPLNMSRSMAWDCTGGVLTSVTDENSNTTSITYNDSNFWRPAKENFPDGGQTSWTYNSPTSITTTTKMNSSQNIVSTVLLDGLGRTSQTQLSDPQGTDYTDTTYDVVGRVASVSNPYRTTSDYTYGSTTYAYDALGRTTNVTLQDGSVTTALYTNNTVTATDPAGKKRQSTFDGLGRLTQVTEDPGGLGYVTTYSYDGLSNLISVTQNGGRQRTFTYDALSRLLCESNPEIQIATCPNPDNGSYTTGTIRYGYDGGGNLTSRQAPAPNQTGSATVTTTYSWDALHRLTQKSYSDGTTPTAAYLFDVSSTNGVTISNPIGRLVRATTNNCIQTINSFDSMGRVTTQWLNTPSYCGPASFIPTYGYDLAGNITSFANGIGVTFSYANDTAGRPTQITSSLVDAQHPATLATVDATLGYYPHGAILKMTFGNGLTQVTQVERRFQPCQINLNSSGSLLGGCGVTPPSGTVQDYHYSFGSWGSTNSGNVTNLVASGAHNFNRTFAYDALDRLSTLDQSSGSATGCSATFNLSWTYDAWGNRTDQTVNSGTCNPFHATVNTKNQLVDPINNKYQYDAAGNMIQDANHTYFYDAENRLIQVDGTLGTCSAATACYQYDAFGQRVEKTTGSANVDYLYDLAGKATGEWLTEPGFGAGQLAHYIYLNGQLVAEYTNGTTYFIHQDHLGSARLLTGMGQTQLSNGGFEQGSQSWNLCSGIPQVITDSARSHSGSNFLWASTSVYACAISTQHAPVSPGEQVTFGGWTYLESGSSLLRWVLVAYDANNNQVGAAAASPNTASLQIWTQEVGTYTIPSGAAYVQIYCEIYQPSVATAARFDDGFLYNNGAPAVIAQNLDYLPFGELNSSDFWHTTHQFTGDERDSETGLDHTWFRQYSSSLGRWMHPDPAGLASVDMANPQSWNRYSYVLNSPLTYIDPLGLTMQMICMPGYSVGYDDYQGSGQWGPISGWCTYYDDGFNYPGNVSLSYNNSPTTSGGGGGGGNSSGILGAITDALKYAADRNRCAANNAGSAASAMGISKENRMGQSLLGNDISAISQFITGPDRSGAAGDLAISNPTPVNVIGIGIKAGLDWIPTSGSGIVLAQNGAGTYYGVGATTTTLGAKTVGKAASSVLAAVAAVKLTADVANYFGSLVACSLDPLKK